MTGARTVRNYHRHISRHVLKESTMDRLRWHFENVLYAVFRRVIGIRS